MNYMQEVDAWLTEILRTPLEFDETKEHWMMRVKEPIKAKILESYRNGQKSREKRRPR